MKVVRPNRIAEQRLRRKLSQGELAERLSIHPITLSKLERGKMKLTTDWMARISEALNVQPADLISDASSIRTIYITGIIRSNGDVDPIDESAVDERSVEFDVDIGLSLDVRSYWYIVERDTLLDVFSAGDFLRFSEVTDFNEQYGRVCLVQTMSREKCTLIGILRPSAKPGCFDLHRTLSGNVFDVKVKAVFALTLAIFSPNVEKGEDGVPLP